MATINVEVCLGRGRELTIPEALAERLGAQPGERLALEFDDEHPDRIQLRRLPRSYAGALAGVYGSTPEEEAEYVRDERASWGE